VLYAKLPFAGGERFVLVDVSEDPEDGGPEIEDARFRVLREGRLLHLGAIRTSAISLLLPSGEVALLESTSITPDSFTVSPSADGRPRAEPQDARPGAPAVALLGEQAWRRHFSADPSMIGAPANLGGVQRTIVGVMPDAPAFRAGGCVNADRDGTAGGSSACLPVQAPIASRRIN
jgi:hypothetical protein